MRAYSTLLGSPAVLESLWQRKVAEGRLSES